MDTKTETQEPTIVVFRKWNSDSDGHDVIALFPEVAEYNGMCMSYMHMGQHGAADYDSVVARTVPATPEEYAPLKRELESAPYNYNLVIRKRRPH
jgi:hypothetical protein